MIAAGERETWKSLRNDYYRKMSGVYSVTHWDIHHQGGGAMGTTEEIALAARSESEYRNSDNWSGWFGELYFSKVDRRWFLRRRNRWMGWAVNLAHPLGVIYLYLCLVFLMLFGFVLGLMIMWLVASASKEQLPPTLAGNGVTKESPPPLGVEQSLQFDEDDWVYPDSKLESASRDRLKNHVVAMYSVAEPIELVWSHYAEMLGIEDDFEPARKFFDLDIEGKQVHYNMGLFQREKVRTGRFLVYKNPGISLSIFLSRGEGEDKTYIELIVNEPYSQLR